MLFLFDLDHTTICAKHRGAFDSHGRGCLDTWRKLSTPENIAKDKALPLADEWRKILRKGATVGIVTSRVISDADVSMLRGHGLGWHYMLSRPDGCNDGAALLKFRLISKAFGWDWACKNAALYDDDRTVIEGLTALGLTVYDSISINERLSA